MYATKLATIGAILATAIGCSALAGTADAQISGSIGGDLADEHPVVQSSGGTHLFPHGDFATFSEWASTALDPVPGE